MPRARRSTASYGDDRDRPRKMAKVDDAPLAAPAAPALPPPPAAAIEPETPETKADFNSLPKNVVIRIFKLLDIEDLALKIPIVCKRWKVLASSEELWKDTHLAYDTHMADSAKKLFFKCMRMAPKLKALTLELDWKDGQKFAEYVNVHSPEEITALHFIYDNMPPEVMFTLLRKHKNHIEKLAITDTYTPYVESDVKKIWSDIQNLSKLKHLIIDGAALLWHKATFKKTAPCWTALQILDVQDSSYENMNTVQKLIAANTNWTEVYLATPDSSLFRGEVKALAKCPNLDCVQVPFCKEIKMLEKCEKLDSLIIDCVESTANEIVGVVSFVSKSTVFTNLKALKMIGGDSAYGKLLTSFLKGRPGINLLNLVSMELTSKDLLEVFKVAPGVERLFLNEMSGECVATVATAVGDDYLPNLKKVQIVSCYCDEKNEVCVTHALDQLKVKRPTLEVISQTNTCKCKPPVPRTRKRETAVNKEDSRSVQEGDQSKPDQVGGTQEEKATGSENAE